MAPLTRLHKFGIALSFWAIFSVISSAEAVQNVDGKWTDWSLLATPCSKSCGGGLRLQIRTCTNPAPEGAGLRCLNRTNQPADQEISNQVCNPQSCWSMNPEWNEWTNCTGECDFGTMNRTANCTNYDPSYCAVEDKMKMQVKNCSTWNKKTCPNPCNKVKCQEYAICENLSTDEKPITACKCLENYVMNKTSETKYSCIRPEPTPPTARPIPTMAAEQKVVATVLSKGASSVLIFFVTLTLILFLVLRVFTIDRVIQMNMEIAILAGHLVLIFPSTPGENEIGCKIVSIALHLFFLACFMFMMLEAVHMYTLVAYVVKKDGLFDRKVNLAIGWGVAVFIVGVSVGFEWAHYGAAYHCWLRMDTGVLIAQQLPVIVIMILTFTLIEAAGNAEYKPLSGMDKKQLTSARFSQRTNLIIMPMVYAHWILGTLAEYEQNLYLYSIFSVLNGILGFLIFSFHCSNNQQVREKLSKAVKNLRGGV